MNQKRLLLFDILESRGISRRWFARQVGIHETTLCKIAKGKRRAPAWFPPVAAKFLQLPESVLFLPSDVREDTESESIRKAS